MIYLASPYAHPLEEVMEHRYLGALAFTCNYIRKGLVVFSPIVHCHHMKADLADLTDEAWLTFDKEFLRRSTEMHIAMLPGWEKSRGVRQERLWAYEFGITVVEVPPTNIVPAYILEECNG